MRLIDADELIRDIREATTYKSPTPGNWWDGRPKKLGADEIIGIIKAAPTQLTLLNLTRGGKK